MSPISSAETHSHRFSASEFLSFAKTILAQCQEGKLASSYSHENVRMNGNLRFNCYGFISYLLQQMSPEAYEAVVQYMYENGDRIPVSIDNTPCPFHYAAFFSSLDHCKNPYWSTFQDFKDLQPGDLLVYLPRDFVPKEISEIPAKRTGTHIMVVEEVKKIKEDWIEVSVIDCTRLRHCPEDSRVKDFKDGVGRSPLTIIKQPSGTFLQWGSKERKWKKSLFFEKTLYFGRLK